jgi:hypothetical protein
MDDQRTNREGSGMMDTTNIGVAGVLLIGAGCFIGHELAVAGSILLGACVIANALRKNAPTSYN